VKISTSDALNHFIKHFIRWGTMVLLIVIVWGCGVVPTLREGSEGSYVRLPFVRILVASGNAEMSIAGNKPVSVECMKDGKSLVYYASHPITVRINKGLLSISVRGSLIGERLGEVMITPRSRNGLLQYNNISYRGLFKVIPNGRSLELINIVHLDEYLKGVVPPEIGWAGEPEFEAVKAQAVAARTYAMSRLAQYPNKPYDMKSDITDQVYHGVEVETPLVSKAIDQTRGYVIKYNDELINAYYHSTCGGYTDDIDEVWDKKSEPYLRAVNDSGFCSWSKYYNWEEKYTAEQLRMRIEEYLSSERGKVIRIGDITDMYIKSYTPGGRISELTVQTDKGSYDLGRDKIRWVFKRSSNPEMILQSARFSVKLKKNGNGKVEMVELIGSGYGHGVGMCQCGAIGMSRAGRKFDDILTFYYSNTNLVKLY